MLPSRVVSSPRGSAIPAPISQSPPAINRHFQRGTSAFRRVKMPMPPAASANGQHRLAARFRAGACIAVTPMTLLARRTAAIFQKLERQCSKNGTVLN